MSEATDNALAELLSLAGVSKPGVVEQIDDSEHDTFSDLTSGPFADMDALGQLWVNFGYTSPSNAIKSSRKRSERAQI